MDVTTVGAITAVIGGAIGALLTTAVTLALKWRADSRIDTQYRDQTVAKGYEFVISQLKERTSNLETVLIKTQAEHVDCLKLQEGFRVTVTMQQEQLNHYKTQLDYYIRQTNRLKDQVGITNGVHDEPPPKSIPEPPKPN